MNDKIYSFSPFGYEGTLVNIQTDLRDGIPSIDIVGIADSQVKSTREIVKGALINSNFQIPQKRILISASPADIKKDNSLDLAFATSIQSEIDNFMDEPCLVLGELELSGNIRPVKASYAATEIAKKFNINNILCCEENAKEIKEISGIKIAIAENLQEAVEKLKDKNNFISINNNNSNKNENSVEFNNDIEPIEETKLKGHYETLRALEIAAAGKHNIILVGEPGSGKTYIPQTVIPAITPKLTENENTEQNKIKSLTGFPIKNNNAPFRMPHQSASIEGMIGGGINCKPGEITLAHNGTLFLDEAAEFRTSVLQTLRVPLETNKVTLSRAGRSTVFPANFQLAISTNPCPCGCLGNEDKICLCSANAVEAYWKKFSGPLLDRIEIKNYVKKDENDERILSIDEMRSHVANAIKIQRDRGIYNTDLNTEQINNLCKLDNQSAKYLEHFSFENGLSSREVYNILRTSLTIANMDNREKIELNDLKESCKLNKKFNPWNLLEKVNLYTDTIKEYPSKVIELLSENNKTNTSALTLAIKENLKDLNENQKIELLTNIIKEIQTDLKQSNQQTNEIEITQINNKKR